MCTFLKILAVLYVACLAYFAVGLLKAAIIGRIENGRRKKGKSVPRP